VSKDNVLHRGDGRTRHLRGIFCEGTVARERNTLKRGGWSEKIFQKWMAFYKMLTEEERQATVKDYFDGILNEVWDEVVRES